MNVEVEVNATLQDFILYLVPGMAIISDCKVVSDKIGMYAHDYCRFFESVYKDMTYTFDKKHKKGINVKEYAPDTVKLMEEIGITNTTVTPYIHDGWLYAGFSVDDKKEDLIIIWLCW